MKAEVFYSKKATRLDVEYEASIIKIANSLRQGSALQSNSKVFIARLKKVHPELDATVEMLNLNCQINKAYFQSTQQPDTKSLALQIGKIYLRVTQQRKLAVPEIQVVALSH